MTNRKPVDGIDGIDGRDGRDGIDGIDGRTPIKGVDYFTQEDEDNFIQRILKKIPKIDIPDIVEKVIDELKDRDIFDVKKLRGDLTSYRNQLAMKQSGQHGGGTTVSAGTGVTLTPLPDGTTRIDADGESTFESVSKNLKSYPYELNYTGDNLTSIVYDLGGGLTITKTLAYTGDNLTTITLSGSVPSGADTVKTLLYTGDDLTDVSYS